MTPTSLLIRTPQVLVRLSSPQITWLSWGTWQPQLVPIRNCFFGQLSNVESDPQAKYCVDFGSLRWCCLVTQTIRACNQSRCCCSESSRGISCNFADKRHRLISCLYLYVLMIMKRIDSSGVILKEVAGNHPYHLVSWGTPRAARGGHRKRVGYKPVHEQAVTEQCNCLPNNVYVDVGEIHYVRLKLQCMLSLSQCD